MTKHSHFRVTVIWMLRTEMSSTIRQKRMWGRFWTELGRWKFESPIVPFKWNYFSRCVLIFVD